MALDLIWLVTMCMTLHIVSSLRKTYEGHQKIYMAFCDAFGITRWPSRSRSSTGAACISRWVTRSTQGNDVYIIRFFKGINRMFCSADEVVRTRAPGLEELVTILQAINLSCREQVAFAAQIVVDFFLGLRTEDHTDGKIRCSGETLRFCWLRARACAVTAGRLLRRARACSARPGARSIDLVTWRTRSSYDTLHWSRARLINRFSLRCGRRLGQ